jgi:hypothetical protein
MKVIIFVKMLLLGCSVVAKGMVECLIGCF